VSAEGRHQRIWVLRDGQPIAMTITVGATDGRATEVTGGDIQPGVAVIVEAGTTGSGS
jgi:HlyD family secretion protein